MKKLIAYFIFVIIVTISSYFIYSYMLTSEYADTAIPYMEKVLPQISTWDAEIVKQYMAPEVLANVTDKNLQELMAALSVIGTLESVGEYSFENKVSGDDDQLGAATVITYEIDAQYSSGEAIVTLRLLVRGDSYEVYHFNFQSQALAGI